MKEVRLAALFVLMGSVAQLSGCAIPAGSAPGHSPAYRDGYNDGCESGRAAQGSLTEREKKDVNRLRSDEQYAKGWSDAFPKCADEQIQRMAAGSQ